MSIASARSGQRKAGVHGQVGIRIDIKLRLNGAVEAIRGELRIV